MQVVYSHAKYGLETQLKSSIFLFAFMQFCARSLNTLYFSIMKELSNSSVWV